MLSDVYGAKAAITWCFNLKWSVYGEDYYVHHVMNAEEAAMIADDFMGSMPSERDAYTATWGSFALRGSVDGFVTIVQGTYEESRSKALAEYRDHMAFLADLDAPQTLGEILVHDGTILSDETYDD
jgi:hypothetical protein